MSEACRIVIVQGLDGKINAQAPMKYKDLCYDILDEAVRVIANTSELLFTSDLLLLGIVMDMNGRVDVAAPLPPREWCAIALKAARVVIERYEDGPLIHLPSPQVH